MALDKNDSDKKGSSGLIDGVTGRVFGKKVRGDQVRFSFQRIASWGELTDGNGPDMGKEHESTDPGKNFRQEGLQGEKSSGRENAQLSST